MALKPLYRVRIAVAAAGTCIWPRHGSMRRVLMSILGTLRSRGAELRRLRPSDAVTSARSLSRAYPAIGIPVGKFPASRRESAGKPEVALVGEDFRVILARYSSI